jgi:hypothetical protein
MSVINACSSCNKLFEEKNDLPAAKKAVKAYHYIYKHCKQSEQPLATIKM